MWKMLMSKTALITNWLCPKVQYFVFIFFLFSPHFSSFKNTSPFFSLTCVLSIGKTFPFSLVPRPVILFISQITKGKKQTIFFSFFSLLCLSFKSIHTHFVSHFYLLFYTLPNDSIYIFSWLYWCFWEIKHDPLVTQMFICIKVQSWFVWCLL